MHKQKLEEDLIQKINANFDNLSKYFYSDLMCLSELGVKIYEINRCLIINANTAAITLTNHTLERLLKIALIENHTIKNGVKPLWETDYKTPHESYSDKPLSNTIELCKKEGLITPEEHDYLFHTVRTQIRNGFSHSDSDKILIDYNSESTFYLSSFDQPNNIEPKVIDMQHTSIMQHIQMDDFVEKNARPYFDKVFNLIFSIDKILWDRHQVSSINQV